MLAACGEKGYRRVAVQDVIDRYGGNRVQFYRHFASKADCYAAAYETEAERLSERILEAAGAASDWRLGLRAGLDELAGFAERRPLLARGLLVEVHVAGGPALARRARAAERFARAIDGGRREPGARVTRRRRSPRSSWWARSSRRVSALAGEPVPSRRCPNSPTWSSRAYLGEDAAARSWRRPYFGEVGGASAEQARLDRDRLSGRLAVLGGEGDLDDGVWLQRSRVLTR